MIALSSVKSGPPKTVGLLAGHDRHGVGCREPGRGRASLRGRVATRLLVRKNRGDLRTAARVGLRALHGALPGGVARGIARVQWRDLVEIEGVVAGELPDPGQAADVERQPKLTRRGRTV